MKRAARLHAACDRSGCGDGRDGFTLLEVLLAAVLLVFAAISSAYAVGIARDAAADARVATTARYLVEDAVAWVRSLPRLDPVSPVFGTEAGDVGVDDVDDLAGVVQGSPVDRAGNAATTDWQRTFAVESVSIDAPATTAPNGSTSLMRVRISVTHRGTERGFEELLLARVP